MKNLVQNKITENLKEKSKMKKFISSILLFTIMGIPMSSSVLVKAGCPGDGDDNGAPAAAQPMQPVVDPQPIFPDVQDGLWDPVYGLEFPPADCEISLTDWQYLRDDWPDAALIPEPPAPDTPAAEIPAQVQMLPNMPVLQGDSADEAPAQPGEAVSDKTRIRNELLGDFKYEESDAYRVITAQFGDLIRENLIDLVNQVRKILWDLGEPWNGGELTWIHRSRKDLMYKYIQDNWGQIEPVLKRIQIRPTVHGEGRQAKRIEKLLGEFNYKTSEAYKLIKRHFGRALRSRALRSNELIRLISVIRQHLPALPELTRDEKRHKALLYKYIESHLAEIAQILPHIRGVFDEYGRRIIDYELLQ